MFISLDKNQIHIFNYEKIILMWNFKIRQQQQIGFQTKTQPNNKIKCFNFAPGEIVIGLCLLETKVQQH